MVIVCIVTVN